jgi:hypothetical protein
MTFSEILPFLNEGFAVRRADYHPALIIFKQVPASIANVKNLKSMPERVKRLLQKYKVGIDYESQYIVYDFTTGVGTYCVFDGEDMDATDWEIIKEDYNPYNY